MRSLLLLLRIALVPLIFVILMISIAATTSAQQNNQTTGGYPTDGLFAQQVTQTSGAIIDYRPPSQIQKFINNDPTNVELALQKLIWQVYRTSDLAQTTKVANEINRQVGVNPESFTGDSIFWFGYRIARGDANKVDQLIALVKPSPNANETITSFNNIAINDAANFSGEPLTIFPVYRLNNEGIANYTGANYIKAIKSYDNALAINPYPNVVTLNNKGLALSGLGNYTGAIIYYDKALAINPNYVLGLNNKGLALSGLGNYTGAIIYYDKALAINPNYVNSLNNKGNALVKLGRYEEAGVSYHKALEAGSNKAKLLTQSYNVSEDYFRIFEVSDIISNQQVSDIDSLKVSFTNLGITSKMMKPPNYILAIVYFNNALRLDHNYFYALWNMADTLKIEQNNTGASYYYSKAVTISPTLAITYHGDIIGSPAIDTGDECNGFFRCLGSGELR